MIGVEVGAGRHVGIQLEEDGLAAAEYVAEFTGVPPEQTAWWGHSIGGSVALHTNDEIAAGAVIIESAFSTADDIQDDGVGLDLPAGWLFADSFDNTAAASEITIPILIIHGLDDDYIRPAYADRLIAAAPEPKQLWHPEGCGHSDCFELIPEDFKTRALAFYAEHDIRP